MLSRDLVMQCGAACAFPQVAMGKKRKAGDPPPERQCAAASAPLPPHSPPNAEAVDEANRAKRQEVVGASKTKTMKDYAMKFKNYEARPCAALRCALSTNGF